MTRTPPVALPVALLATTLLVVAGCGSEAPPEAAEYVVTDGWTGEVVIHSAADLENAPELRLVEHLRLGTLDGPAETQFFRIADVDVANGELWVLDSGHDEVRIFDFEDGAYLRTVGRRGEGPGEFMSPSQINIHGGVVAVGESRQVSFFDLEGTLLQVGPGFIQSDSGRYSQPIQAGPNWFRTRTVSQPPFEAPRDTPFRDTVVVHAVDPFSAAPGPEILRYPTGERIVTSGEFLGSFNPFMATGPVYQGGADGNFYYTPADEHRVDIVDAATGRQIRRVVNTMPRAPVTQAMFDEAVRREEEALSTIPEGDPFAEIAKASITIRRGLPLPEARRITNAIRVAADGRWAIIRGDLDPNPHELGDPARWDVYGPSGKILGWFMSEPGANIRRFTGDHVMVREEDDLGIQQLVVYRLEGIQP